MNKVVVSFLGRDCPGIVHAVASLMNELDCNIDEVSQTILHSEFAAIVIADVPDSLTVETLHAKLEAGLAERKVDLNVTTRLLDGSGWGDAITTEPFVVTVDGPDRPGLIAGITGVFARHNVNIENLKALMPGGDKDGHALIVYEVALPASVDPALLRAELREEADRLAVRVSMQHRDIFEAVHRVQPV
ncbi:ACT domain-containing protein [Desulfovibrio mangrovi]|uniref:glycine cleavage system protein R n=1 Tax=Desulfovibrio mangrovi TaxID=2976983 RepID=UPI00224637C8|nr:ACT domain-containing protein [Desulfovibrio mangrovi]UZP66434.1 ACT domain-containing protein [Desulfovibrio mangrovi]